MSIPHRLIADVFSSIGKAAHALCRLKDQYVLPPDIAAELQEAFDEFSAAEYNLTDALHKASRRLEFIAEEIEAELLIQERKIKSNNPYKDDD